MARGDDFAAAPSHGVDVTIRHDTRPAVGEGATSRYHSAREAARRRLGPEAVEAEPAKLQSLDPAAVLQRVWGYDAFLPGQREVIDAVLDGRDALAILPTGAGKSLCYQLPALISPGLTLVVSPLLALMREQVAAMKALGAPAEALNSDNTPEEDARIRAAVASGQVKLLYCAPERLARADMPALLEASDLSMIAVDEAHCIAEWGHDFRPDYLCIGPIRRRLEHLRGDRPGPQLAAFTATADLQTRAEILEKLFGASEKDMADPHAPKVFVQGFDRPNLHLRFEHKKGAKARVLEYVRERQGQCGIVYCGTRRDVEVYARHLADNGVRCCAYHAGMTPEDRMANQTAFARGDSDVMVATIAFGMGVDKADIRFVVHTDLPKSVESYYQEIGRAGRDGAPAEALALYGLDCMRRRRRRIEISEAPEQRKQAERDRFAALMRLAEAPVCRRQTLLAYFGETLSEPCGNCDLCAGDRGSYDGTIDAQKALSAVARTGESVGVGHLIAILRGEPTDAVLAYGHQTLPTFGVGADKDRLGWRAVYRQLFAQGLVDTSGGDHCVWRLTAEGRDVLKGARSVLLRQDAPAQKCAATRKRASDNALLVELRRARRELAMRLNVPTHALLSDRALVEIARERPDDVASLTNLRGVDGRAAHRLGDMVLDIVRRAS